MTSPDIVNYLTYKQKKEGEDRIREIDELISENPYIKNTERILSENAMKKALAEFGKKVKEAEEKGKVFKGKVPSYENDKYGSIELKPKFKSTSTDHKKILFIDVLKMKVLEKTDTGNPKLSDDIIQKYADERPDIDILRLFSEKAKLIKSLSTYVDTWIDLVENDKDGRLRSTFNPLNTSGRLRGSNPNLLNITKDGGLKDLIEPDYKNGFVIGQIDVNSLEERVGLLQHQDPLKLNRIKLQMI
jgi:DNA polymerase I-like protein with 3'-5' exonuclease and polymerase domains